MSKIKLQVTAVDAMDGAGVPLKRVFGHAHTKSFDPFLMLDYFSLNQGQKSAGFPWHPHAGIETITYLLSGELIHEDTLGNKGILKGGEIQWMSAGSGLYHQELPQATSEPLRGFQFWLNLPKEEKYKTPEYNYIEQGKMPIVTDAHSEVRVVAGTYQNVTGPINKEQLGVRVLHLSIKENTTFEIERTKNTTGFLFVFDGSGMLEQDKLTQYSVYLLEEGNLEFSTQEGLDALFVEGIPLQEPIAWYGPVVMNTNEEVRDVLNRLREELS